MKRKKIIKFYKIITFFAISVLTVLLLFSCSKQDINSILENFQFEFEDKNNTINSITNNFRITNLLQDQQTSIIYVSDKTEVIKVSGNNFTVVRYEEDIEVKIEAIISFRNKNYTKTFKLNVKGLPIDVYSVTLPQDNTIILLTSCDLTKVPKDTEITFKLNIPENFKLNTLFINNKDKTDIINDGTFSIIIKENTTISLKMTKSNPYLFFKVTILDNSVITLNTINVDLNNIKDNTALSFTINVPNNKKIDKLLINNINQKRLITNNAFTLVIKENCTISVLFVNKSSSIVNETDFNGYYKDLVGIEDEQYDGMINKLRERLIRNFEGKPYKYAKNIGQYDEAIDKAGWCWSIYDDKKYQGLGWPSGGKPWNREHVWACAWLGEGARPKEGYVGKSSDLHNLRVCTHTVNSSRNNKFFININEKSDTGKTVASSYFPGDLFKGDVARILMYMSVRWQDIKLICQKEQFPSKINGIETAYNPNYAKIGDLETLLKWHKEDPVDEFEKQRNNRIFNVQKNRNPFVDYPHLFEPIWIKYMEDEGKDTTNIDIYLTTNISNSNMIINYNSIIGKGSCLY